MSDIDLTAAIEKAVDVLYDWNWDPEFPPENEQNDRDAHRATAANLLPHVAPLIESAVREQIAAAVEANAAGIAKAAEGWRASEQHPVNSPAAKQYDRVNAEVREAMAKHLRTVVIPLVRGESRD